MASESLKPGGLSAGNARLSFDEQIKAIKGKLLLPTESYREVDAAGHERGFVVAGAQKADMLADFYRAATAAIEKGETLEDFQSRFDDTVAHFGWDYNGTRAWRSRVIFQTNLNASYAQGRFTQLQAAAGDGLLWMYKHSDLSVMPRASHAALSGLVVSPSNPWWRTHYPPWVGGKMNYGCRCYVVAVHPAEVTRRGGRFAGASELKNMGAGTAYLPGDGSTQDLRALVEQKIAKLPRELGDAFRKDMEARLAPVPKGAPYALKTSRKLEEGLGAEELRIAAQAVEHAVVFNQDGDQLLTKGGVSDRVVFSRDELQHLPGAVVLHNHPEVASLSPQDVRLAIWYGVAEMRVVDRAFRYSIAPPPGVSWTPDYWRDTVGPLLVETWRRTRRELWAAEQAGKISRETRLGITEHLTLTRVSDVVDIGYRREKRG